MQNNQTNKFIELKLNYDFGGIITAYFEFLKQNIKKFSTIFISYNGLFLIGLLAASYLLVTGYVGLIASSQNNSFLDTGVSDESSHLFYIGAGFILFGIILIIVTLMNYSLAASYIINYEKNKGNDFDRKAVWELIRSKLGDIIVFVLLLVVIYVLFSIVGFILLIIPIAGVFAFYIAIFWLLSWFGVSFITMLHQNKGVVDAFGQGWNLVNKNFWKSVGVNFVLGFLNMTLSFAVFSVPLILIGIYSYNILENNEDFEGAIAPKIIYTIGLFIYFIVLIYGQCLSQFGNGILYYALHEKTHNTNIREKIAQIGNLDQ